MINQLIVLADELDKCGEKEAANTIDKLIKTAIKEELRPLAPEADEFEFEDDVPTKTDMSPLPPLKDLIEEQRQKLERTFSKEKPKGQGTHKKEEEPRDMINKAIKMLFMAKAGDLESVKEQAISLLEKALNAMH